MKNLEEVQEFVDKKFLYFTTALSTSDPIIQSIKFDYVVCDESSQIIEARLIKCLSLGKRFVLIGDYL